MYHSPPEHHQIRILLQRHLADGIRYASRLNVNLELRPSLALKSVDMLLRGMNQKMSKLIAARIASHVLSRGNGMD